MSNKLQEINVLYIAGYSFGDKGINSRLIHWIESSSDNRIVLIHKNHEKYMTIVDSLFH